MKYLKLNYLLPSMGIGVLISILSFLELSPKSPVIDIDESAIHTFLDNGKKENPEAIVGTYQWDETANQHLIGLLEEKLENPLTLQKRLFKFRSKKDLFEIDNLKIGRNELIQTVDALQEALNNESVDANTLFDLYQIKGKDNKGSVYFTGYFTPVLKVSKEKKGAYQYPLYKKPQELKGKNPTRAEIEKDKVLDGQGLEIAYASNPVDVYFMQVQGSGYVEFINGGQSLLSYSGSNKKPYRSIGRYMLSKEYTTPDKVSINSIKKYIRENPQHQEEILFSNPSYVFFEEGKGVVKGAGTIPLTAGHSIAVDPRYIPLGSTLLGRIPIADEKGKFTHHEYRILFAQDIGGSIKGAGRVDLYTGVGKKAKNIACDTHHYGELWLILPKSLDSRP